MAPLAPPSALAPAAATLHASPTADLSPSDPEAARRVLKIRLLRDLVSHGLYRVPTDALAERLGPVLED